ncbi:MAG: hypothetical protein P8I74_02735, partial [Phycisphaerales bacterium]|nr:hypothetical protein [Phycisphaerales bacterium]
MDALHTTVLCLASAVGGEQHDACDMPEINPFPLGSYSWIDTYQSSIDESSLYHRDRVHNCDGRWSKLRLMADHPSVEFASWSQSDEDEWEQSIGQIDNPVLVVTWAFSTLPNASESIADVLSPRRTMQEYVTSEQEAPATIWFTMHGNALEYLDALDLDRSCFN